MYANLNIPQEEDFTFLLTAFWHWYQKNKHPSLKLIERSEEIEVEPPAEAKIKRSTSELTKPDSNLDIASQIRKQI